MVIANFTPDTITWTHAGLHGQLNPQQHIEVDNGRGNHILNKWGDRGLVQLQYGDEEKLAEKKKIATTLYTRFWTKQIVIFNQHNETLKNENKPYVMPGTEIEQHAKALGIEVVGPWKLRIPVNNEEIKSLKKENTDLKDTLTGLASQVAELTRLMKAKSEPNVIEQDNYLRKYRNKGKIPFKVWVEHNALDVSTWPPERQDEVRFKWDSYGYNEAFPVDLMNIDLEQAV